MKRILLIIGGILIVNTVLSTVGFGAFMWRFSAKIPAANYEAPRDEAEARRQDLDYLLNLTKSDYSFSVEEKSRFKEHVSGMTANADAMTKAEFAMGVAAAAGITENGHTNASHWRIVDSLNNLPVRFFWFGDGLHIVRAREAHADLIGARVVRYDGATPETLVSKLDPYHGGNDHYLRFRSPLFFGSPAAMHAAGVAESPDQVTLTLQFSDGKERDVVLEAEQGATPSMRVGNHALPAPAEEEIESGHDWQFFDPTIVSSAYYAKNPDTELWRSALPGGGVYVRLRITMERSGNNFSDFLTGLKKDLSKNPADYLVLDLRSNPGGDYMQSRSFAHNIADFVKPDGKIYLLSDGGTFSAALVTMAYAVHDAGERGVIVGTHPGDDQQFWAESGGVLKLPNSGLRVSVSTGYHDWENGCKDWRRCFWPNIILGVAAGKLDPDIVAPLTYSDYAQGIDTTLQAVFAAESIETNIP